MPDLLHGGRLEAAKRRHPNAPLPWIDLSTGVNPHAYPFTPPPLEAYTRLPEPEHIAALEAAAARAYGVPDPAMVVAAPGTQALIQLLPRLFPRREIAIPGPTYAEHAAAWAAAGTRVHPGPSDATVMCNPNNPDGRRHDPAGFAAYRFLIADEAYADFEPLGLSAIPLLPRPGLIVLRSFGKAYGLAGVRLGFAIAEAGTAARIRVTLGPWAVSGAALAIGTEALDDTAWRDRASATARTAAARLAATLSEARLPVVGGTTLFRLAKAPAILAEHLAASGILVRTFPGERIRFGLPPDTPAMTRLARRLGLPGKPIRGRFATLPGGVDHAADDRRGS